MCKGCGIGVADCRSCGLCRLQSLAVTKLAIIVCRTQRVGVAIRGSCIIRVLQCLEDAVSMSFGVWELRRMEFAVCWSRYAGSCSV